MFKRSPVPRYIFGGKGQLCQIPEGPTILVTVVNISTQGCFVEGPNVPAVGEECELLIEWQGRKFRCNARVRWKKPKQGAGLEFLHMDENGLAVLRRLFATLQLEPPKSSRPEKPAKASKPERRKNRSA